VIYPHYSHYRPFDPLRDSAQLFSIFGSLLKRKSGAQLDQIGIVFFFPCNTYGQWLSDQCDRALSLILCSHNREGNENCHLIMLSWIMAGRTVHPARLWLKYWAYIHDPSCPNLAEILSEDISYFEYRHANMATGQISSLSQWQTFSTLVTHLCAFTTPQSLCPQSWRHWRAVAVRWERVTLVFRWPYPLFVCARIPLFPCW
jgi:hypothetical protein